MKRFIIPAAGFGKRVGSPKAKELLFYSTERKALLYYALELAWELGFMPVVISRNDKAELNEELFKIQQNKPLEICLIESSEEWPDTIRQSEPYWSNLNILVLPDSRFFPTDILSSLEKSLLTSEVSFATFPVTDLKTWGVVGKEDDRYFICEKPKVEMPAHAWGLIGFRRAAGRELFEKLHASSKDNLKKHLSFKKVKLLPLASYEDVTRENKDLSPKQIPD